MIEGANRTWIILRTFRKVADARVPQFTEIIRKLLVLKTSAFTQFDCAAQAVKK